MDVKQIYENVNEIQKEVLGKTELVLNEDLSNLIDIGDAIFNANAYEKYVNKLINRIGKTRFMAHKYNGSAPSILMDAWEYGSIMMKVSMGLFEAKENESWTPEDGHSYDQNIFYAPKGIVTKFFNKKTTFEVDCSFTEKQIKQSFTSAEEMNAFLSMIEMSIDNTLTVAFDELIMRTINNLVAETVFDDYQSGGTLGDITASSGVKAVNLLYEYNQLFNKSLTAIQAMYDPEFIRFASAEIMKRVSYLKKMTVLFNVGGQPKFTPKDRLHLVMLESFRSNANVYLQSDTFHDEFTELPKAESVAFWQGSGKKFAFGDVSKITVKTASGKDVTVSGVLCTLFDTYAAAVTNYDKRVKSHVNNKAEFYSNFYKEDANYMNDLNENCIVFFIA